MGEKSLGRYEIFWYINSSQDNRFLRQNGENFIMIRMNRIEEFCRQIGHQFGAERVVLFGSYAHGVATADSDVDILVIGPFKGRSADHSVKMRMKLCPGFPVDITVRTAEKIERRLQMGDDFMREILEKGKVLYEADNC